MKRVEVKLSVPVVAPLLDVVKQAADSLQADLAAPLAIKDIEGEFRDAWTGELLAGQAADLRALLALFDREFLSSGVIGFDEENAEIIVRACSAVRLRLRSHFLGGLDDEKLESGDVELVQLDEAVRKAFMCYLFLATIQELIIQHLDSSIIES
ncbi:MAG TPA: hypothetical protein VG838_15540 [Opitutaceae bacterium]|nr:hypothetical protein [Opitutaceae bacterium]